MFIELHDKINRNRFIVNTDNIRAVYETNSDAVIELDNDEEIPVREAYFELKAMLFNENRR